MFKIFFYENMLFHEIRNDIFIVIVLIVGHFLLTVLLTDRLIAAAPSRVVTVASSGHMASNIRLDNISPAEEDYNRIFAYSHSKQANILFSAELGRRLKGQKIKTSRHESSRKKCQAAHTHYNIII